MAAGEDDADDIMRGRPPARADRTWQHPSEFAAAQRVSKRRADRRIWTIGLLSAVTGALAVGAVWYVSDPARQVQVVTQRVSAVPVESVAPRVTPADEWATEVASESRPATAVVASPDGVEALAAAIAVHDDGYLLTSARALGDATEVLVQTHDGQTMSAVVLGHDPETDLSVLKAEAPMSPAAVASEPASAGDAVAVIDPDGSALRHTVTGEAASSVAVDGDPLIGFVGLDGTSADVPAGSAVFDATGSVVGIVAATDPDAAVTVVPIDIANAVAHDIITDGTARKAWIGLSAAMNADRDGIEISAIITGSPADDAGLQVGDRLIAIDDQPIETPAAIVAAVRRHEPGTILDIEVARGDESIVANVLLGEVS